MIAQPQPDTASAGSTALIDVRDLSVALPNGTAILERTTLLLRPGEVVALLGPSGAGKSTLLQAVFAPDDLRGKGYAVSWGHRAVTGEPAYVPQRGALLDHLDVAGNVELAQAGGGQNIDARPWFQAVDLDADLATPGRSVSTLSGGQAQRVAVARVLAAARRLIVMDEPSVGLDPVGVRMLARLLVTQARRHKVGIVVITHDLALAGGTADRILFLDPGKHAVVPVVADWRGPCEFEQPAVRQRRLGELDDAVEALLLAERPRHGAAGARRKTTLDLLAPLRTAGEALARFFQPRLARESAVVLRRALGQALLRPFAFYATVGALLGFTVPYIVANISSVARPEAVLALVGGTYILSLAPPLSAIVFAATSGSAINAWLGGLRLHGQVVALEGFGVPAARYLWAPAWFALALSYLVTVVVFALAMVAGGWVLFRHYGVPDALTNLTADFLDPKPDRMPYLYRGIFLVFCHALGVSSIVVARGSAPKERSEEVTNAMTGAVMHATLYVVVLELLSIAAVFRVTDR